MPSSTVSPDQEKARITSSRVIMPRSPWLASLGCTKEAGVPVEESVPATFMPIWPLLPMPVTITRPRQERMRRMASAKLSTSSVSSAASTARNPWASSWMVRAAEAIASRASSTGKRSRLRLTAMSLVPPTFPVPFSSTDRAPCGPLDMGRFGGNRQALVDSSPMRRLRSTAAKP